MPKPFEYPPRTTKRSKEFIAAVLWDLALDGPVVDRSGHAISILLKRLEARGYPMSINSLNRIVNSFTEDPSGNVGDYPYNYIERIVNARHTKRITLVANPKTMPFPENPFKRWPEFNTLNGEPQPEPEPAVASPPPDDPGETFTRQRMFEGDKAPTPKHQAPPPMEAFPAPPSSATLPPPPPPPEPPTPTEPEMPKAHEPEPDDFDVDTALADAGDMSSALEPYRPAPVEAVTRNGDHDDDLYDLPHDLFTEPGSRGSMELISNAITLLSEAMTAQAAEQVAAAAEGVDRQIDARLGEFRQLMDRTTRAESKLRQVVGNYQKVIELAKAQRDQISALQKKNAILSRQVAAQKGKVPV